MKEVSPGIVLETINSLGKMGNSNKQLVNNLVKLGMDSITFIQMVVALEEAFEWESPDEKLLITEMDTVQKIYDVLQELYESQLVKSSS